MQRLYLLGEPELRGTHGKRLRFPWQMAIELLAYLWLHRDQPQSRQRLAGLLWPESSQKKADQNLRTTLYHLRRALNPDGNLDHAHIHSHRGQLQFNPEAPLWVDVGRLQHHLQTAEGRRGSARLHHLERAAGLYRGDLLEGCYADWCLPEREHLKGLYRDALTQLVDASARNGNYVQALAWGHALTYASPLDESAYRDLMLLHYANGNRSAALDQYRACRHVLRDELDISPEPETKALCEQIEQSIDLSSIHPAPAWLQARSNSPRLAVLPLVNMSPNPEDGYFTDGMTEEVINTLSAGCG